MREGGGGIVVERYVKKMGKKGGRFPGEEGRRDNVDGILASKASYKHWGSVPVRSLAKLRA